MRGLWSPCSNRLALVGALLLPLIGAPPAAAAVIVPVSLSRTVTAGSSVRDLASGAEDVHPGQPLSSTDPSLTLSIGANSSSSLLGWSAQSSASSGTVTLLDLGSGLFGVNLSLGANASASGNTTTCSTCSASANSSAQLALTFDLTAPIHVSAFVANGGFGGFGGMVITLSLGNQLIATGGTQGSLPFDVSPGRYVLQGSATASASIAPFQLTPTSYASLLGLVHYTVIPEPGSGLLVAGGLLGFAVRRRARR